MTPPIQPPPALSPGRADLLSDYDAAAAATDALVADVDLDDTRPLPEEPWFTPGASWSARRVVIHLLAETAQHAGHADTVRGAIDGQKGMGSAPLRTSR